MDTEVRFAIIFKFSPLKCPFHSLAHTFLFKTNYRRIEFINIPFDHIQYFITKMKMSSSIVASGMIHRLVKHPFKQYSLVSTEFHQKYANNFHMWSIYTIWRKLYLLSPSSVALPFQTKESFCFCVWCRCCSYRGAVVVNPFLKMYYISRREMGQYQVYWWFPFCFC